MTTSSDRVLERLTSLHPKVIDLTLGRVERLLADARPSRAAPAAGGPCGRHQRQGLDLAMIRAGLESGGAQVHVYTSPHLARFHERIRLAGEPDRRGAADGAARAVRGGQRRPADHLLRDHHRRGLPRLRRDAGGLDAAGGRPRRAARRDQRGGAGRGCASSPRSRWTTSSISARPWRRSPARRRGSSSAAFPASWRARPTRACGHRGAGGRGRRAARRRGAGLDGLGGARAAGLPGRAAGSSTCRCRTSSGAHQVVNAGIGAGGAAARSAPWRTACDRGADPRRMAGAAAAAARGTAGRAGGHGRALARRRAQPGGGGGAGRGAHPAAGAAAASRVGMLRTKDAAGFLRPLAARAAGMHAVSTSPARRRR